MKQQRGNILFLILLAVVLFAALSYAVTGSQKGGVKDGSSESADSAAASIVQSGALLENTVSRLRLTNGCTDMQISFQNNSSGGYTNPNAPADKRCHVFDPAGGGLSWPKPPSSWIDPYFFGAPWTSQSTTGVYFPSNVLIANLGTNGALGAGVDLIYAIPFIKNDVCKSINRQLGLASETISSNSDFIDGAKFNGTYSSCAPSQCNYTPTFSANGVSITHTFNSACIYGRTWGASNPEPGKPINVYVRLLIAR